MGRGGGGRATQSGATGGRAISDTRRTTGRTPGDPGNRGAAANPPKTDPLPTSNEPKSGQGNRRYRPSKEKTPAPSRTDTFNRQKTPLRAIYGKRHIKGAHRVYDVVIESGLHAGKRLVVYFLCWATVNSVTNIKVDGRTLAQLGLTSGTDYNLYNGTSSAADAIMATTESRWAAITHPAAGNVVQLVVRFKRPSSSIPAVDVEAIEADVEGLLVRDPRTDPTATKYYRDNPALCIADFECDSRFGGGFPTTIMDWAGTITEAANDCDFIVSGATKRYTIGLELDQPEDFDSCLENFRQHAALQYAYNNGLRQWWIDKARDATGITFANGAGTAGNVVGVSALDYRGTAQIPTRVVVWFTDEANGWKESHAFDEVAATEVVEEVYNLWGVRTYDQAKRLARYIRKAKSVEKSGRIRVTAEGLRVLPGSRVTISNLVEWNWAGVDVTVMECSPTRNRSTWDLVLEPYDAGIFDDTVAVATGYSPPANPSPYDTPPEIIGIVGVGNLESIYFEEPQVRSVAVYGTGFWAATNLFAYDGTKVNDGVTNVKAFDWNAAGASRLTFDAGVGVTRAFRELAIAINVAAFPAGTPSVEWSDDSAAWSTISMNAARSSTVSGVTTWVFSWTHSTPHRYWRIVKSGTLAEAVNIHEVQFRELTGPYLYAKEFKVYDYRLGYRELYATILANKIPTAAEPLAVTPIRTVTAAGFGVSGGYNLNLVVSVVSDAGIESEGYTYTKGSAGAAAFTRSEYVRQAESSLVLVNGANNDIALPTAGPTYCVITGPTGAFSITGFDASASTGGEILRLRYNGSQICTITDDVTSTIGNRSKTDRGSVITVAGSFTAQLTRCNAESRWIVDWVRDSVGYK